MTDWTGVHPRERVGGSLHTAKPKRKYVPRENRPSRAKPEAELLRDKNPLITKHGVPIGYTQKTYIVPIDALKEAMLDPKMQVLFKADVVTATVFDDEETKGWQALLGERVGRILKEKHTIADRRIGGIMASPELPSRGKVVTVKYAEAIFLSIGLRLDQDVVLPILPGSVADARDLLMIRSGLDERGVDTMIGPLLRLCNEIVKTPDWSDAMLDKAPFDCLRPPPRPEVVMPK